ncbi:MAG: hypothetical protein CMN30_09610 [Sandaracinus sp.]|nr:hypothetical protein [Sandaracinus sp.]
MKRLGLRMTLLALLGASVGLVAAGFFGVRFGVHLGEDTGRVIEALARVDARRCTEGFAEDRLTIHGYDAAFQPLSPGAPAVPAVLRERARAGLRHPAELYFTRAWDGDMLVPAPAGAPCAHLMARWTSTHRLRDVFRDEGLLALTLLLGLTTAFILWLGLRPLRQAIERLRQLVVRLDAADRSGASPPELRHLPAVEAALERSIERVHDRLATIEAQRAAMAAFLADVAHDVKTPLASLHLTIDELGDPATLSEAERDSAVQRLSGDVVYLRNLFANLALAARLRDGEVPVATETVDLREVAERVRLRAAVLAKRKGLALRVELPREAVPVSASALLAERVLENLVDNSLLHGADGETVVLRLRADAETFELAILDDGPGVPPQELPRLGERTFRSDAARQRDQHGSGLGLAIVGEACARFGWTLRLEARAPRGLAAYVGGPLTQRRQPMRSVATTTSS